MHKIILTVAALATLTACAVPVETQPQVVTDLGEGVFHIYDPNDGKTFIGLTDEFTFQTDEVFLAALKADPNVVGVSLRDHYGGYVETAYRIGYTIRANGLSTYAAGECASACVDVFVAGVNRDAAPGTYFGLHSPSEITSQGKAEDFSYYSRMGVPQMYSMTYAVPYEDIVWLSAYDAQTYGLW